MVAALGLACAPPVEEPPLTFTAVTFNTGTSEGMGHDGPPDDGYTGVHAGYSDLYYGDGLAWQPAVDATRAFLQQVQPDVVGFQEIFYSEDCAAIPAEAQTDFVCQTWQAGDPTVAQIVVGEGYQVACHPGHPDKCAAVKRSFGRFRGCEADFCLEGLAGSQVAGCGRGARIGRGVIDLVEGDELTLVNVHASSGMVDEDMQCRVQQVDQVFVDLGDGAPAANGERNFVLGDLNTDPGRWADWDPSARRWTDFAGRGKRFHFVSPVGNDAPGTYAGLVTIDHMLSDVLEGSCWAAGVSEGHPAVIDALYFDHRPLVCALDTRAP
ncbi:MAG: hypothetical protein ABIJ09_18330 [Pseudomonadota bacterium]